jgi:hypothetical protein
MVMLSEDYYSKVYIEWGPVIISFFTGLSESLLYSSQVFLHDIDIVYGPLLHNYRNVQKAYDKLIKEFKGTYEGRKEREEEPRDNLKSSY